MLKQYFNLGAGLTRVVQFRFSGAFFTKTNKPKPPVVDKRFFKLKDQK
jgi:hypothetical protein